MRKFLIPAVFVIVAIIIAVGGRYVILGGHDSAAAAIGGPFTLTNHKGEEVTEQDFRGKLMLIYFGYTYCPDVCPTGLAAMSSALQMLGPDADQVAPILVTVDPERDTAQALATYVGHFHPSLVGLTGSPEQIAAAAKAFKVFYRKANPEGSSEYLVDHSSVVYLMGRDGAFLLHFSHQTDPEAMAAGIKKFL